MKTLIIGGCGYIGSALYRHLEKQMDIDTLDQEWYGNYVNPNNFNQYMSEHPNLEKYDALILLAGHSSVPMCKDRHGSFKNNVINFINLLQSIEKENPFIKFIYASSSSVYGDTKNIEATEEWEKYIPKTHYDLQKQEIDAYAKLSNIEYYGLRFGTVNGWSPNLRTDIMINKMYESSLGGEIQVYNKHVHRPILGIMDLCRAVEAILHGSDRRGIYNLASFNSSVGAIADEISNIVGNVDVIDKGEAQTYDFSISSEKFKTNYNFEFLESVGSIINSIKEGRSTAKSVRIDQKINYSRAELYCVCCNSNIETYLNLGFQPLANSYHHGESLSEYPLNVNLCQYCFHSQLSIAVSPDEMFKNYLYVSGTTSTFQQHCNLLATDAVQYFERKYKTKSINVLDVACNDGTLLEKFKNLGCSVQGIDPAENLRKITSQKDIPVTVGYWGDGSCTHLLNRRPNIITGTNVFAHVGNPSGFLDDCLKVLHKNGVIILEFPYCDKMINHCEFDTIYHEHFSYFLVNSFAALAENKDLRIDRVIQTPIHGGSIRFFLERNKDVWHSKNHCDSVKGLIQQESDKGLLNQEIYHEFGRQVEKNKSDMVSLIDKLKADYKIVGFGASAKGNTMLNHFKLDLDYIVDDNPMKWGYKTPGRNIPICSPNELHYEKRPLAIVILSWNFADEIINKIKKLRGKREDVCVFYVPTVHVSQLE